MIYHFLLGRIFHLTPHIIESILKNADHTNANGISDHFFCIMNFSNKMLYSYNDCNVYIDIFKKYEFFNYCIIENKISFFKFFLKLDSRGNKFIFHSALDPFKLQLFMYIFFLFFSKRKLKKSTLVCWGQNNYLIESPKKYKSFLIKKIYTSTFNLMDNIITLSPGDYDICTINYPKASCRCIPYIPLINIDRRQRNNQCLSILISHSGWPHNNHLKAFKMLEKFKHENIKIICPLCYGDAYYISKVTDYGFKIFGDKFTYFTELKPFEEYENLIRSINIYITAANIQTGLFALLSSIVSGAKVYITGNLLYSMKEYGFIVNNIDEIPSMQFMNFCEGISEADYDSNIEIYRSKYCNISKLQDEWKAVYLK